MNRLRAILKRLGGLFFKEQREREFSGEMERHLQFHVEDNLRSGMSPSEARRQALLKLGGLEQTKQLYRERRSLPMLETLLQDLKFAVRMLRKSPGFTVIAVLTLAFGIGGNTAIFSLVNSVLLRPLSYKNPEQLYVIREIIPQWAKSVPVLAVNLPNFQIWQKECRSFDQISIAEWLDMDLSGSGEAEEIHGIRSSANLLDMLGQHPALGRSFLPEEDQAGHDGVVILTDGFWRSRFHADPGIIGRAITLDGAPHMVIGVLPASFHFPREIASHTFGPRIDFFKPLGGPRFYEQDLIGEFDFTAIGRLKQGVTPAQALSELNVIQAEIAKQANENLDLLATLSPLEPEIVGPARKGLLLLLAAVGAVLLIVCVNLANLLLARAPGRMREAAIRNALGAGPARLMRQLLTESLLLALLGGILGVVLAYFGVRALVLSAPVDLPRLDEVALDGRVLCFALGLSALVGGLFGMLPAWRISRADPQEALKAGATTTSEGRRPRQIRESLIGFEVGLCTALLILAGLLISSLFHVLRVNPGFTIERVLAADVDLPPQGYSQVQDRAHFYDQVLAGLRTIPGVESVGWVTVLPLEGQGSVTGISLPGEEVRPGEALHANYRAVSPDYFRTMAIPLIEGRLFNDNDHGKKVVIVSKTVAERLWPGQSPVGRECVAHWGQLQNSEVIGVVGDIRTVNLEAPPLFMVYVPDSYGQQVPGAPDSVSIVVRTSNDPNAVASPVRSIIHNADPNVPILALRPMTQVVSQTVDARRFQMILASLFAACALLLASLGIYGVVSYNVERRSFELGVRLVLGAEPGSLLRLIVRQGMIPVAIGLGAGIVAAAAGARFIQSLLFGVGVFDLPTFACVGVVVAFVACAACYLPARRTLGLDPAIAIRYE
jgi:predicted permease